MLGTTHEILISLQLTPACSVRLSCLANLANWWFGFRFDKQCQFWVEFWGYNVCISLSHSAFRGFRSYLVLEVEWTISIIAHTGCRQPADISDST